MAYQSIYTGQNIDDGIGINTTQNSRLTNLENKDQILENEINTLKNTIIPISQGGTGATSAEQALINLGVQHIYYGTEEPPSSLGNDGDLYICYRE